MQHRQVVRDSVNLLEYVCPMWSRVIWTLFLSACLTTLFEVIQEAQSIEEQRASLSPRQRGAGLLKLQEDEVNVLSLAALPESMRCLRHWALDTSGQIVLNFLDLQSLQDAWRPKVEWSQVLHEDLLGFSQMTKH